MQPAFCHGLMWVRIWAAWVETPPSTMATATAFMTSFTRKNIIPISKTNQNYKFGGDELTCDLVEEAAIPAARSEATAGFCSP